MHDAPQNSRAGNGEPVASASTGPTDERLDGWKAIASYLKRDIRTVQRWEHSEHLPVRRHEHQRQGSAFAYRSDLDRWLAQRSRAHASGDPIAGHDEAARPDRRWRLVAYGGAVAAVAAVVAIVSFLTMRPGGPWARSGQEQEPRDEQAYAALAEGQAFYAARRYHDAIAAVERALARDDRCVSAWVLLAKAHGRLAPPAWAGGAAAAARATVAADRALQLAPNRADVQVAVAMAARAHGRIEAWRAAAERAIELDPRMAEAHALLGDSYSAMVYGCGRDLDAERADAYYRRALELKPDLTTAVSNRATNLRRLGRYQECIDLADRAIRSLSDETPLRLVRGACRLLIGDIEGAAADLEPLRDSPKLSPVSPLVQLGLLSLMRGNLDEGVRDLEAASRIQPGPLAEIFVAEAYAAAGDLPRLASHLRRAFEQDASCRGFVAASPAFSAVREVPEIGSLLAAR